ncbi:nucleotidyltransferase domain protein [Vibrio cholerae]|nr:nucleotidyltransferase domain protein [Vibrio cholerae]
MLSSSISLTKIGLKPHQYALIREAVLQDSRVERAWIFGSRALGTFKDSSDTLYIPLWNFSGNICQLRPPAIFQRTIKIE